MESVTGALAPQTGPFPEEVKVLYVDDAEVECFTKSSNSFPHPPNSSDMVSKKFILFWLVKAFLRDEVLEHERLLLLINPQPR